MAAAVKITIGARVPAGGPTSLGRRLQRIIAARGGNAQRWLIGHLSRIADDEEKALGVRQRAARKHTVHSVDGKSSKVL